MIHLIANRSQTALKVFAPGGSLWETFHSSGDAWGNHGDDVANNPPPWGTNCWIPIGHYVLGPVDVFNTPIASEGYGQIPVSDVDAGSITSLVKGGYATVNGLTAKIGGIEAPLAQLGQYDRSAVMVHCGGSNSPDPLAPNQGLYRTLGCQRLLNQDWQKLAAWLQPLQNGNIVVFTALEIPADLGQ